MRTAKLSLVVVLLALCLDTTFANGSTAELAALREKCERTNGRVKEVLDLFPESVQDQLMGLSAKHGATLAAMFERRAPAAWGLLSHALLQTRAGGSDVVALLEVEEGVGLGAGASPTECLFLGMVATVTTLLATFAAFKALYSNSYLRKLDNGSYGGELEEFAALAEKLYMEQGQDDEGKTARRWALPPSGFSKEERKLYNDFLLGTSAPEQLRDKFEARRELEKRAYEDFLNESLYIRRPADKGFVVKVMLPALAYLVLHVATYVAAYQLGRG